MNNKGFALSNLNRKKESIKAFDACIEKFSNETDKEIQEIVKEAREKRDKLR